MASNSIYKLKKADSAIEGEQHDWMYFHSNSPSLSFVNSHLETDKVNSPSTSAEFVNNSLTNVAAYTKATGNTERCNNKKKNAYSLHSVHSELEESSTVNDIANAYATSESSHKHDTTRSFANNISGSYYTSSKNNYEYDNSNFINDTNTRNKHHLNSWSLNANDTSLSQNVEEYNFLSEPQSIEEHSRDNFYKELFESNAPTEISFSSLLMSMSSSVHFPFWWNSFAPTYPARTRKINYIWENSFYDQHFDVSPQHTANASFYKYNNNNNNNIGVRTESNDNNCGRNVVSCDVNRRNSDDAVRMDGKYNALYNEYEEQEMECVYDNKRHTKKNNVMPSENYEYKKPLLSNDVKSPAKKLSERCSEEELKETVSWDEFKRRIDSLLDNIMLLTVNNANVKPEKEHIDHNESKAEIRPSKPAQQEVSTLNNKNNNDNNDRRVAMNEIKSILVPSRRCRWNINTSEPLMMRDGKQLFNNSNDRTTKANDELKVHRNTSFSKKKDAHARSELHEKKLLVKTAKALSPLQIRVSPLCPERSNAAYSLTKFASPSNVKSRLPPRQRRVSLIDEAKEYSLSTILENNVKEQKSKERIRKEEAKKGITSYEEQEPELKERDCSGNKRKTNHIKNVSTQKCVGVKVVDNTIAPVNNARANTHDKDAQVQRYNISHHQNSQEQYLKDKVNHKTEKVFHEISTSKTNTVDLRERQEEEEYTEGKKKGKSYQTYTLNVCDHTSLQANASTNDHNEYSIELLESEEEEEELSQVIQQKHESPKGCEQNESSENKDMWWHQMHENKASTIMFSNVISTERKSSLQLQSFSELLSGDYTLPTSAINDQREHNAEIPHTDQPEKNNRNSNQTLTNFSGEEKNDKNNASITVNATDANSAKVPHSEDVNSTIKAEERKTRIEEYLLRRKTERLLEQQRRRRQQIADQRDSMEHKMSHREILHYAQLQQRKQENAKKDNTRIAESDNKLTNIVPKKPTYKDVNKLLKEKEPQEQITTNPKSVEYKEQHKNYKSKGPEEKKMNENREHFKLHSTGEDDKCTNKEVTGCKPKVIQERLNRVYSILVQLGARGLRRHGVDIRVVDACTVSVTCNSNDLCKSHFAKEHEQHDSESKKFCENYNAAINANKPSTEYEEEEEEESPCSVQCINVIEKPGTGKDNENMLSYAFKHYIDEHIEVSRSDGSRLYSLTLLQMARKFVSGYDICLLILASSSAHFVVQQAYNELTQGIIRRQSHHSVLFAQIMYLFDDYVVDLSCGSVNAKAKKHIILHEHVPIIDSFVNDVTMVKIDNVRHLSKLVHNAYNAASVWRNVYCASVNTRDKHSSHYLITRLFLKQVKETEETIIELQQTTCNCESEEIVCGNEHFSTYTRNNNQNMTKVEKHEDESKFNLDVLISSCYICDVMFAPAITKTSTQDVKKAQEYLAKLLHSTSYTSVLCAVNGKDDKEILHLIRLQQKASSITKPLAELRSVRHFLRTNAINKQNNCSEHYSEQESSQESNNHYINTILSKNSESNDDGNNVNFDSNNKNNVLNDVNNYKNQLFNRHQANIFAERILQDSTWFDYEHLCMFLNGKIDVKPESTRFIVPSLRQWECQSTSQPINNDIIYNDIEDKHRSNESKELLNQQNNVVTISKSNPGKENTIVTKVLQHKEKMPQTEEGTFATYYPSLERLSKSSMAKKTSTNLQVSTQVLSMSPGTLRMKDMHLPLWVNNEQGKSTTSNFTHTQLQQEQLLLSSQEQQPSHSLQQQQQQEQQQQQQQQHQKERQWWETNLHTEEEQLCLHTKNTRPKSTSALKSVIKNVLSGHKVFVPLTGMWSENNNVLSGESEWEVSKMSKTFDNQRHRHRHRHNNSEQEEDGNRHITSAITQKEMQNTNMAKNLNYEHVKENNIESEWKNRVSKPSHLDNESLHSLVSSSPSPSPSSQEELCVHHEQQYLLLQESEQQDCVKKTHNSSSSSLRHESNSSFFSTMNNIHTVVMLYSFCKESASVTRDGNTIIATTQDDFEEHEVDEVLSIQDNNVAPEIQPEFMRLPSSTITTAAKTFLHGCNVAVLCSESDNLHSSYEFVCATVHTILTLLHELSSRVRGALSFSLARVTGDCFHDCLAPHDNAKPLKVAVSPLFGSCIHDCFLRPLTSVDDFARCLLAALELNNNTKESYSIDKKTNKDHCTISNLHSNKNCMIFCYIIAKLRIKNNESNDGSNTYACSLTATFVKENIQLYEELLVNKCQIPHTLLHHALGGPCYTVALLGLRANEQNAHKMLLTLDRLGSINNRPLRSGNVLKFIKGVQNDLAPAIRQKFNVSSKEIEKETFTKILKCLLEMKKDGEELLNDFEHNEPKAYLFNTNTDGLSFFMPNDSATFSNKEQHEEIVQELHSEIAKEHYEQCQKNTEAKMTAKDKNVNASSVVHTLLCVQEMEQQNLYDDRQMQQSQSLFHVKQNIVHFVDKNIVHRLACDDIVVVNRNDDENISKLLQSEQLVKLTEAFNNGKYINLLALDSASCAMTPVILRRVVHNIMLNADEASQTKNCEGKNNKARCGKLTFYVSIVLIEQSKVTDLLVESIDVSNNNNNNQLTSREKVSHSSFTSNTGNDMNDNCLIKNISSQVAFSDEAFVSIESDSDFDALLARAITNADDSLQSDNPGLFVTSMIAVAPDDKLVSKRNGIDDYVNNKVQRNTTTTTTTTTTTAIVGSKQKMCEMHSTNLFTCVAMFDAVEHLQRLLQKDKTEPSVLLQRLSAVPNHTLVFQCIRNDENDRPITFLKALSAVKTINHTHENKMSQVELSLMKGNNMDEHISRALHALRVRASQVDDVTQIEYINKRIEEIEAILTQSKSEKWQEQKQPPISQAENNSNRKHETGVDSERLTALSQAFVPLGAAAMQHLAAASPKPLLLRNEENSNSLHH